MTGYQVNVLVDSCNSDSFIREGVVQRLNLSVCPTSKEISMASASLNARSLGFV